MTNFLEYFDFARDAINVFSVSDASFFQNFDGYVFLGQDVLGHLHLAEGALTERFTEYVVAELGASRVGIGLILPICLSVAT